jgi:tRNA pseudouridine38-40 synthase
MQELEIERRGDIIVFTVRASAFLHHMVRNLVGSLIYVGLGRNEPDWMAEVLAARSRDAAAPTFMPDGLYLLQSTTIRSGDCRRRRRSVAPRCFFGPWL